MIAALMNDNRIAGDMRPSELGAVALQWLACDPRARLVITKNMEVRWINQRATEAIERTPGVAVRGGALAFRRPAAQRQFVDFVERLDDTLSSIAITEEHGPVTVFRGMAAHHGDEPLCCLQMIPGGSSCMPQYRDLELVFHLTPAENRVATMLLAGMTAAEIASRTHLSVGTVRTHIRRIYLKVGVKSREGLLGRFAPYSLS